MTVRLAVLAAATGAAALGGAFVHNMGVVSVSVQEKRAEGDRIHLVVPAVVVPLGLRIVPDDKLRRGSERLRPWLPAIERAAAELAHCPDGPLMEVESADENISLTKRSGSLVMDVDSAKERVHISIPLSLVHATARYLKTVSPAREPTQVSSQTPPDS